MTLAIASSSEELHARIEAGREAERVGDWDLALRSFEAAFRLLDPQQPGEVSADLLRWIGTVHRRRGDLELANEAYLASHAIARANGLTDRVVGALNCLAIVDQTRGDLERAKENYREAQTLAASIGDRRRSGMIEQNLGTIANIQGDLDAALACYHAALASFQAAGDRAAAASVLTNLGMAHVDLRQFGEAERSFGQALSLAEWLQDSFLLGSVELNRAELYVHARAYDRARECCDRAFEIFGRLKSGGVLGEVHKQYGVLYRETRKPLLAETSFERAAELARECQVRLLEAETLSEWALLYLAEERNREALQCLNSAHRLFSQLHASQEILDLDRRLDRLEGTYLRVVQAWGESIESKDRYTAGHCERVASYACSLAEAVGITGRDLAWLRMGGYLHDVGKIAVPVEVLNKPGKLDADEWRLMQSHTVEGDAIVAELNFPWDIRPVVRSHHERWDGTGYPDGLRGEEIPLTARILCVADVYDALTTTRSYRPALGRDEALGIMAGDVGRIFDPELFAVFRVLAESGALDGETDPGFRLRTAVA